LCDTIATDDRQDGQRRGGLSARWTSTTLRPWPPYITERIKRFGEYPIDGLDMPPEAFALHLALLAAATAVQAA
jgi:hypothetical protein